MNKESNSRTKPQKETADIVKGIRFRPSESERLEIMRERTGTPISAFIKRATEAALDEFEDGVLHSLPYIPPQPSGEFTNILELADRVRLGDFGKVIGVKSGDFLAPAIDEGLQSVNDEFNIPESSILLMRPYTDPENKICYVRIFGVDNTIRYTIKKWVRSLVSGEYELWDGANKKMKLSEGDTPYPIAVMAAIIVPSPPEPDFLLGVPVRVFPGVSP